MRTLSIIKPDATKRGLTDQINQMVTSAGLKISNSKTIDLSQDQAQRFYQEHSARPFFSSLINYMTSGEVVVQVLEGEDAVNQYRRLMGATDPKKAEPGTIRAQFGENIEENSVHGSDSEQAANREISFFFPELD